MSRYIPGNIRTGMIFYLLLTLLACGNQKEKIVDMEIRIKSERDSINKVLAEIQNMEDSVLGYALVPIDSLLVERTEYNPTPEQAKIDSLRYAWYDYRKDTLKPLLENRLIDLESKWDSLELELKKHN